MTTIIKIPMICVIKEKAIFSLSILYTKNESTDPEKQQERHHS